ncbi:MAG: T9SS type A sorting domain-containing protein, partial [bacterium]
CYGAPQTIWQDPNNPDNVHAVFVHVYGTDYISRHVGYFFSSDGGMNWGFLGDIEQNMSSHFPSISGFDNGKEVICLGVTGNRTKLFIDLFPGAGSFEEFDVPNSDFTMWPKMVAVNNDNVVFSASINNESMTNTFDYSSQKFSGYVSYLSQPSQREAFAKSNSGEVGLVYVGSVNSVDRFNGYFRKSTDYGITWAGRQLIWDYDNSDSLGCLRGNGVVYLGEIPVVAFETSPQLQFFTTYPRKPSQIRIWSPNINGGVPVIAADSSIIPFYPDKKANTADWDFVPICRPVIGKSSSGDVLILTFSATTGDYAGIDSNTYYASWITFSTDGGATWFNHQKITPETPLRDWRFICVSPTNNVNNNILTAQMVCVSDTTPGVTTFGAPWGDAELVGIRHTTNLNSGIPISPRLISPSHNSSVTSLTPLMNWNDVSNASSYEIIIGADEQFTNVVFNQQNITSSEIIIPSNALNINTNYYWKVNAANSNGTSIWTPTRIFSTNVTAIQQTGSEIPLKFNLSNNYPNPFNPDTKINFSIPTAQNTILKVYDALGKEIATLVNERLSAGNYSVSFNAANLNSGIYFYTLGADNFRETKKMLLVK